MAYRDSYLWRLRRTVGNDLVLMPGAMVAWSGTHRGPLGEIEATGARVEYCGAAFFRLANSVIAEAWVVGDTQELWRTLGMLDARLT